MTTHERHAKMRDCMSYAIQEDAIASLIEEIENIDKVRSVEVLFETIRSARLN